MTHFTLTDVSRLHFTNASGARTDQAFNKVPQSITLFYRDTEILQCGGAMTIDGVLNDDGLIVSLRPLGSKRALREKFCDRFSPQELPKICGVPESAGRFCDVTIGETSEGLALMIESHRCYAADTQGNASTLKV